MTADLASNRLWGRAGWARHAVVTAVAGGAFLLSVGVPTDLIDNRWFSREIAPTWWSWPSLVMSSLLAGLLAATYVSTPAAIDDADPSDPSRRRGMAGGLLTFFAVGCPVCNKLVLVVLGGAGALRWFEPVQPLLAVAGIAGLAWALRFRLQRRRSCSVRVSGLSNG